MKRKDKPINLDEVMEVDNQLNVVVGSDAMVIHESPSDGVLMEMNRKQHLIFLIDQSFSMSEGLQGEFLGGGVPGIVAKNTVLRAVLCRSITDRFAQFKEAYISFATYATDLRDHFSGVKNEVAAIRWMNALPRPTGMTFFMPPLQFAYDRAMESAELAVARSQHAVMISDGIAGDDKEAAHFIITQYVTAGIVLDWIQIGRIENNSDQLFRPAVEATGGTYQVVTSVEEIEQKVLQAAVRLALPPASKGVLS